MACFIAPMTEAIITTAAEKIIRKHEISAGNSSAQTDVIPFSQKLGWLNKLLWGGSALLAFEHLWHGEIQPFYPFLTAGGAEVWHEIATVGVGMAVLVTGVWGIMAAVTGKRFKNHVSAKKKEGTVS